MQVTNERAMPAGAERSRWLGPAVVVAAAFLLWKSARGVRDLAWTAFGLGMAAYWTGLWPF
ncbi:hypothetical protein QFW80_15150 [Luteimonas sp. M1R5S18]|uniref:Uncharacterized protein n=1 Tax=Luteimonas rhizosphaericola TaxID=3042024 RepID=A0ABT6JMH8_9GAMM|nr:hypothetical protein [Luteimonas rhizosphaericola]MDH5831857.1 hypothetical protein [Luteimonas rhizosphaericola]